MTTTKLNVFFLRQTRFRILEFIVALTYFESNYDGSVYNSSNTYGNR